MMMIAVFLVLNTMLGIIAERKDSIRILSTLGVSPVQIAAIFLAESLVYAFLSGVLGYITGLAGNALLFAFNLLPEGFYANFASTYVILAVLLNLTAMVGSTFYPLRQASRLAAPTVERAWKIPTDPMGDEWTIPLPFVSNETDLSSMFAFMKEYFEYHAYERVGVFQASDLKYREEHAGAAKVLEMRTRHIPWDMAIFQQTRLIATRPADKELYSFEVHITREVGYTTPWKATNQFFLDNLRRQLLIWGYLSPEDKAKYGNRWPEEKDAMSV